MTSRTTTRVDPIYTKAQKTKALTVRPRKPTEGIRVTQPPVELKRFVKRGDVVGKQVIDNRALVLGSVRDISFALVGETVELALAVDAGKTDLHVPWTDIQAIGDVVLLEIARDRPTGGPPSSAVTPVPSPVSPVQPSLPPLVIEKSCLECGYRNPPDAKFCIKCGKKLP